MSIKSLTRVYCDRCNPNTLNGGAGAKFQGVLTIKSEHRHAELRLLSKHGWQRRGDDH